MEHTQEDLESMPGERGQMLTVPASAVAQSGPVSALDRWLLNQTLSLLNNPPFGFKLWTGDEIAPQGTRARSWVRIPDRRTLIKLLLNPSLNFGDLYANGSLQVEGDLWTLVEDIQSATQARDRDADPGFIWRMWRREPRRSPSTVDAAKGNIHHHYDLGNDFYRLWLDQAAMQYTCAYYAHPEMTLEQAQIAKLDHVCRKLRLRPGDTVLEAGSGWGGLARHMARQYGVNVRAFNISREQVAFARERAAEEGLAGRVEYVLDDYRSAQGKYDVFVSVGMLEHVGPENYRALGAVIRRCLKPDGRGLIHSVGSNVRSPMNEWLQRRIFPGSYVPTLREMMDIFEPHGFSVLDVENLRLHYALTLKAWLERFERHADEVRRRYDENFVRAWRLYLAGCGASFNVGALQLFQVVFAHGDSNALAWSRRHLYDTWHEGERRD
jgi:cyclopropane-fatty-acyl-phospholipid synthase